MSKLEKFIEKAINKYGNKYNYNKFIYINSYTKGIVICPEHGEFLISPNKHLTQSGCPICGIKKRYEIRRMSLKQFIEKAKSIHGDKYDYSKVNYINIDTKICIICPIHGEFWQTPYNHLKGSNCTFCMINKRAQQQTLTTEEFIKKAKSIHGDKYDYSKVNYINNWTKICIICRIHGEFYQLPYNHLLGKGCESCSESIGERLIKKILIENKINFINQYKIPLNKKYKYDFYLPEYNLLIEFHGIQHYEPVKFFGGENQFKIQKNIDIVKKAIARDLKYKLIEVKYSEINDNNFKDIFIKKIKLLKNKLPIISIPILEKW